ncbi:MAG: nicotinate-nucleotide diphosphorylase (carboxylating) [Desulfobacteraceae bacterium 4572_87]|nr:MAG: nicotinate-nucleotide diphosphorylase (carboxylating) [Desulfobacteraceae bacterium 4572_87]
MDRDRFSPMHRMIRLALEEDMGPGDATTRAVVNPNTPGKAILIAREKMTLAGMAVFERTFHEVDPALAFVKRYQDGDTVPGGSTVCQIKGRLTAILSGERTALNFLQRMSGIATLTRRYVAETAGTGAKILDTRKTAPGLRWFDKYAVRTGGGQNHRFGLFDGILIKDNHIAAAGSIQKAILNAREGSAHTLRVEVEVENLTGVEEALHAGADIILLDNMTPTEMKEAVRHINGAALVEASGGITLSTVQEIASTGVDFISVGALTHSPKAADFSLEIKAVGC